ncbi:MAG: hypothetical protein R2691_10305 [Solirubrobacterales bacterium]
MKALTLPLSRFWDLCWNPIVTLLTLAGSPPASEIVVVPMIASSEGIKPVTPTVLPSRSAGEVNPEDFSVIKPPSGRWTSARIPFAPRPSEIWVATSMPSAIPKSALPASISFSVSAVEVGSMISRLIPSSS